MPSAPLKLPVTLEAVEEEFIALWRTMGALWGMGPTMAEIHGLLYITGSALSTDDIMARLSISRGNASTNLGKLLAWGLVRRIHRRGDRRDYYEAHGDAWNMLAVIATQRKRREIDPILTTLSDCQTRLAQAPSSNPAVDERHRRISDLYVILSLLESLAQRFFASQQGMRAAVDLLSRDESASTEETP